MTDDPRRYDVIYNRRPMIVGQVIARNLSYNQALVIFFRWQKDNQPGENVIIVESKKGLTNRNTCTKLI